MWHNPKRELMNELLIDIECNVYETIKIGNQIWMAENLRVSHFNNGDELNIAKNRRQCEYARKTPTVYKSIEDSTNYIQYGLLYNSFTVFDKRNIAPSGWHIPTIEDWEELVNFLGGKDIAGRKLKSQTGWKREVNQPPSYGYKPRPEFGGTNESGFTALPNGKMITCYQNAYDVGMYSWNWASSQKEVSERTTWYGYFSLNYYNASVAMGYTYIKDFLGIRCVKNKTL